MYHQVKTTDQLSVLSSDFISLQINDNTPVISDSFHIDHNNNLVLIFSPGWKLVEQLNLFGESEVSLNYVSVCFKVFMTRT